MIYALLSNSLHIKEDIYRKRILKTICMKYFNVQYLKPFKL